MQEKSKVRWKMDAAADCETPDAFYRVEEGGEFFDASILGKREERVDAYFVRGKEHVGRLLIPVWMGGLRMQWRGDV
jgi:hypothetical protein